MKLYLAAYAAASICVPLALLPISALAQEKAISGDGTPAPISFETAVVRALNATPDLRASQENSRAAAAQTRQARVRPNPEIEIDAENIVGTDAFSGFGGGEYSVSMGQRFERGGKQRARLAVARGGQEVARLDADRVRLDVIYDVQRAYIELLSATEALNNAKERAQLASEFESTVQKRVESARDPVMAGQRIAVQALQIQVDLDQARRNLTSAKRRLSSLWGEPAAEYAVDANYLLDMSAAEVALDVTLVEAAPDLLLGAAAENSAEAVVEMERATAKQDPKVSLGMRHLSDTDDVAAIVSFSMPLAFFDTNKGNIDRAMAERRRAAWETEGVRRRLISELDTQVALLEAARSEASAIRDVIIPQAETALGSARDGYIRGAFTDLDVLDAQRTLKDLQARETSALTKLHMARAAIDRITAHFSAPFPGEETQK